MLITFSYSLDPAQARQCTGPDPDQGPNYLTLMKILKNLEIFSLKMLISKKIADNKKKSKISENAKSKSYSCAFNVNIIKE